MPSTSRASKEIKNEAEQMFNDGMKLVDIAKQLDIPEGTVRSWKNRGKWGKKETGQKCNVAKKISEENATLQKNKSFGQPRNRKAKGSKGGAAPVRNKNAEKHGAYSKLYFDVLDDQEMELIMCMDDQEEWHLVMQLQMFSVRERRLMNNIKRFREIETDNHGLSVESVSKVKKIEDLTDSEGNSVGEGKLKKVTETTTTNTKAVMKSILALESELTKVQRSKTKCIESLAKIRIEKAKEQREKNLHELQREFLDARIEQLDAQTKQLLGMDVDLEDVTETDNMIYGSVVDDVGDSNEE